MMKSPKQGKTPQIIGKGGGGRRGDGEFWSDIFLEIELFWNFRGWDYPLGRGVGGWAVSPRSDLVLYDPQVIKVSINN